jgi:hypothetical protein
MLTNLRTIMNEFGVGSMTRTVVYGVLVVAWAAAVGRAVHEQREHPAVATGSRAG